MVAPVAAMLAAAISGEPLLAAHWTQTFMPGAGQFVTQWFPMFLLGGLFGKLMDDSGSITSIARFLTERLGTRRTILSVVLASAAVTYGGVRHLCCLFRVGPHGERDVPGCEHPASFDASDHRPRSVHVHDVGNAGNAVCQQCHSNANACGTTTFAAPGLGIIASIIIFVIGMWWLRRAEAAARRAGEGYDRNSEVPSSSTRPFVCRRLLQAILIQLNFSMASTVIAYPPL